MMSRKLADGSGSGRSSYEPACVRALDSYMLLTRQAERVSEELDQITIPGMVDHPVSVEDSLVIALQEYSDACAEAASPLLPDSGKKP